MPVAWNRLNNLAGLGTQASQWMNYIWNAECCKNISKLRAFISRTGTRPIEMSFPLTAWVKLNCCGLVLCILVVHAHMGFASSPNCDCGTIEQIANHILITCPIHGAPHKVRGLTALDDKVRCWLNIITSASDPGSRAT